MRLTDDPAIKGQVKNFYDNINIYLKATGLRWMDLAKLIGVDHRTLSSMKSQNQNPSVTTAKKIADALGCSIEELLDPPQDGTTRSYNEMVWALKRLQNLPPARAGVAKSILPEQITTIAYSIAGQDDYHIGYRSKIVEHELAEKLNQIKAKMESEKPTK